MREWTEPGVAIHWGHWVCHCLAQDLGLTPQLAEYRVG